MILMKDVTGYQVGKKVFERGGVYVDERGQAFIDQAYHLASIERERTGKPIVTLGKHSKRDKVTKVWVPMEDSPEQIDKLVSNA